MSPDTDVEDLGPRAAGALEDTALPLAGGPPAVPGPGPGAEIAVVAAALVLAGCGGGGGGAPPAPTPPALTFTGIALNVATDDPAATVQVATVPAASGRVRFALDGGGGTTSRRSDPGSRLATVSYDFAVSASSTAGAASADCYVAINPGPERSFPTASPAVRRLVHLLSRIGGVREDDLGRWLNVDYATAVGRIVDEAGYARTGQAPPAAATFRILTAAERAALSDADRAAYDNSPSPLLRDLRIWWFREMILTSQPLLERMALFWSGLLVVSYGEVFQPRAMADYLDLLRRNALGSFRDLIHGIARDPGMVMYLNSNTNVKGKPNENFARELMELFTLGEGQVYTEADVVQVAKCFTGWGLDDHQQFKYWQTRHEPGPKTVFGTVISFPDSDPEQVRKDGEAVIDLILAQDRVAVYLSGKLWDAFIGGPRDDALIATWAGIFRGGGDYDVRRVLKVILTSAPFTDPAERGNMLRSPIELLTSVYRVVGLEPVSYPGIDFESQVEEQFMLGPPNVRGWVGGTAWITAKTLLDRRAHMQALGWEFYASNHQKVPLRLDPALETLWFATPVVQRSYVDAAATEVPWDKRGERIRRLLVDPALNCK